MQFPPLLALCLLMCVIHVLGQFSDQDIISAVEQARTTVGQAATTSATARAARLQATGFAGGPAAFAPGTGAATTGAGAGAGSAATGLGLFTQQNDPPRNQRLSAGGTVVETAFGALSRSQGGAFAASGAGAGGLGSGPQGFSAGNIATFRNAAGANCDNEPNDPCDPLQRYRRTSGQCNNLLFASIPSGGFKLGAAFTAQGRFLPQAYDDGDSSPRTRSVILPFTLPNARFVSRNVHSGLPFVSELHTTFLTHFGQFIDHDIVSTPTFEIDFTVQHPSPHCCVEPTQKECFNINFLFDFLIQGTCIPFPRALNAPDYFCNPGPRLQVNQRSSFIDGTMIYGWNMEKEVMLRQPGTGLLITNVNNQLKMVPNTNPAKPGCFPFFQPCFDAGDHRSMETPTLTTMHIAFLRRHNQLVEALSTVLPANPELLFQEAKRIVIAELQHITYNEFLPRVLCDETLKKYEICSSDDLFADPYSPYVDPRTTSSFSTAAYRFGHSLVRNFHNQRTPSGFDVVHQLQDHFDRPGIHLAPFPGGATEGLARWMAANQKSASDRTFVDGLQNNLFRCVGAGAGGPNCLIGGGATRAFDLSALNIQRGRDHGVASYTTWRLWCTGKLALAFTGPAGLTDHSLFEQKILKNVYRSVHDIDLFTGAMTETRKPGALVGPTFSCIIGAQFSNYKRGDRFWYERPDPTFAFTPGQLQAIKETSLAKIICSTMPSLTQVQQNIMDIPSPTNPYVDCNLLRSQDILPKIPLLWNSVPPSAIQSANALAVEVAEIRRRLEMQNRLLLSQAASPLNPAMALLNQSTSFQRRKTY